MTRFSLALVWLPLLAGLLPLGAQEGKRVEDPDLPSYVKSREFVGDLTVVGSDTMSIVLSNWSTGFSEIQPGARFVIDAKGSNTAPVALTAGTAQLAPMSREMKAREIDAFIDKHGYPPTALRVGLDALALVVHKDNPLDSLTLDQIDALFSKGRKRGHREDLTTWGQLGAGGEWTGRKVALYGRNSLSGTHTFFREMVLRDGEFKDAVREQPGSAAVVAAVARDVAAIGYCGLGYAGSEVKKLRVAERKGDEAVPAQAASAYDGSYPLSRTLYVYLNRAPGKALHSGVREFCRYILSREGQTELARTGFIPLPASVVKEELKKLD
jgi:phosphate transport system substrate-binding protein